MANYLFQASEDAAKEVTNLFEFVWPTAVALWNMRWQVEGFVSVVPNATYKDVEARFVVGSGIHGADVRGMRQRTTWDEQIDRFAEFILTNTFAIYEGWSKLISIGSPGIKDVQLGGDKNSNGGGLVGFISAVKKAGSKVMHDCFESEYAKNRKSYPSLVEDMMVCYKYFKQIRNCIVHNNRVADKELIDRQARFLLVSSSGSLKLKEPLQYVQVSEGERISLKLRGVVGFTDIVLRIISTVDVLLVATKFGEEEAVQRIKKVQGPRPTLNADRRKAFRQMASLCARAGLRPPVTDTGLKELFLTNRLAHK